ncbi:Pch2p [Sporobolomyces salmoneus]|uniref:Pch2p n=1 Tax=Sporobolomyces salmoneus TaxID=183962 RepID=UPI00316C65D5
MPVLEFSPPVPTQASQSSTSPSKKQADQSTNPTSPTSSNIKRQSTDGSTEAADRMRSIERSPEHLTARETEEEEEEEMELANTQSQELEPRFRNDSVPSSDMREAQNGVETEEERGNDGIDSDSEEDGPPLHVEVRLKPNSTLRYDVLRRMLYNHLNDEYETLLTHSEVHDWREVAVLDQNVDRVWIGECSLPTQAVPLSSVTLELHLYQPPSTSDITEFSTNPQNDEDGDSDVPAASVLELPALSLEGVWDTLIYEGQVKEKLLGYIYSTMLFSDASVDFNIVTWNRVVLLHGPPGTGKTSLCRSLAQKLAIRLSDRYDHGKLIEINSHSLFSKWFSESGKLVQRLFAQVTEMVDDENCFVVVLIDEVESLTAARAGAMSGKEPSDALRVVNALLTQLDKLKQRKNCLVMTTSNLSSAIDNAFIDRADIKQYIGLPPTAAVYWILQSCLNEIMRAGLIPPVNLFDYKTLQLHKPSSSAAKEESRQSESSSAAEGRDWLCSLKLEKLAEKCQGMSGRTLRRLPVLAHARHIGLHGATSSSRSKSRMPKMEVWLEAMEKCVEEEGKELDKVLEGNDC